MRSFVWNPIKSLTFLVLALTVAASSFADSRPYAVTEAGLVTIQSMWISKPFADQTVQVGPTERNVLASQYAPVLAISLIYDATPNGVANLRHTARIEAGRVITESVGYVENGRQAGSYSPALPADQNLDGFLDATDLDLFVAAWVAGDVRGDFNADGFVDAIDYDRFILAWDSTAGIKRPAGVGR